MTLAWAPSGQLKWMNGFYLAVARKVFGVEGEDARDAVNQHGGNQPRIMHLNSRDAVVHQQPPLYLVHRWAVGEQIEAGFNLSCSNIRLFWR